METNCFSNITFNYAGESTEYSNVFIVADNIHTLLIDDLIYDHSRTDKTNNIYFGLNVKHFALSPHSLEHVDHAVISFLRKPIVFKFGVATRLG